MQELCCCDDVLSTLCPVHDDISRVLDVLVTLEHRLGHRAKQNDKQEEVRNNRRRKQMQGSMKKQGKGVGPPGLRTAHVVRRRTMRAA